MDFVCSGEIALMGEVLQFLRAMAGCIRCEYTYRAFQGVGQVSGFFSIFSFQGVLDLGHALGRI
jgi:hypothetical protein